MKIERRYEPDPENLDRVVEVLFRLLVESPGIQPQASESAADVAQELPCLPTEQE